MPTKRDRLVREIRGLMSASDALSDVLERYKAANATLIDRVKAGESVLEALDGLQVPMRRHRELTETLEEFEAARHRVRRSLIALSTSQGASLSELARKLGISRQLASRLAAGTPDPND
ncbi:MAG TPA: hypothetical protein VED63_10225 [Acidimicrobiales bacterium]|nr:hypothetical protein [Acidimicrobiales bacterium]